jgi:hypothetical protein
VKRVWGYIQKQNEDIQDTGKSDQPSNLYKAAEHHETSSKKNRIPKQIMA